jgi:hypothetical protein
MTILWMSMMVASSLALVPAKEALVTLLISIGLLIPKLSKPIPELMSISITKYPVAIGSHLKLMPWSGPHGLAY